ncbi:hypothetical protein [Novosphingobium sp. Leaf2]|uniref:hypothetical protein n=1 Tax=Novosphingobium sp. Leaf2 TaxID=1735670 RepID=UPI0006F48CCE|nr:hypothetical protein [Novosphingobium sp. Leaf2]KQM14722.1 hypothetical protein ASE49_11140 [Novosphingobium sp. Leaf2]
MKLSNLLSAATAVGLVVAPVAAQAGTAAAGSVVSAGKLSDFGSRRSTKVRSNENLDGTSTAIVGALAAATLVGGAVIIADDNNNKSNGSN